MTDIWIAVGGMLCIATIIALLVFRYGPRARTPQFLLIGVVCVLLATFAVWGFGKLKYATVITHSAAIIWTNLMPLAAGIGAGVVMRLANASRVRRVFLTTVFAAIAIATVVYPLLNVALRPPPNGANDWRGRVAMQSSPVTCSPAAAATFLTNGGVPTSESELIGPCFTDSVGTPTLGVYRGVKLRAAQEGRDVVVLQQSIDEILDNDSWPILAMVKLPLELADSKYAEQWGLIPGLGHSVVIFGIHEHGGYKIGDPAAGLERWQEEDLRALWDGTGIRFVPDATKVTGGYVP